MDLFKVEQFRTRVTECGRIAVPQARQFLNCSRESLEEIVRECGFAIGEEEEAEFVVSNDRLARLKVVTDYLQRHPEGARREVLNSLLGLDIDDRQIYKVVKKEHRIPIDRGLFRWVEDARRTDALGSVARAARALLFRHPSAENLLRNRGGRVWAKIQRLWEKRELVLAIDGGETNSRVAKELVQEAIPSKTLQTLTYITNYPEIEETILNDRGKYPHDPVLIGGRKREDRGTYVGRYAEAFWKSLHVLPDAAFIGTSTVSDSGDFGAREFEESRFKALLLGSYKSTLRCIITSSEKVLKQASASWVFADMSTIDVVITDQKIHEGDAEFLKTAKRHGVLVVTEGLKDSLLESA